MRARRPPAAAGALLGLVAALACEPGSPPPGQAASPEAAPVRPCTALERREPPRRRSLVLVVSDTLRRDRLGAYGGPAPSPAFDAFAARGFLFTRAGTPAPWTKPAMASLFTGLPPSRHGLETESELSAEEPVARVLADSFTTLAEDLRAAGYRTAGFMANPWMVRGFGFDQGFGTWVDEFAHISAPGSQVVRPALRWLGGRTLAERAAPFFLYVHLMDAHGPYPPLPRELLERQRASLLADRRPVSSRSLREIDGIARTPDGTPITRLGLPANRAALELAYDQGVRAADAALGLLLRGLARATRGEAAPAVWVTADHGEALFSHGWRGHGRGLHDDEIGVPMAARLPGIAGPRRVECALGLDDLRPTLCSYLGVPCPGAEGVSLLPPAAGEDGRRPRYLVTEAVSEKPAHRAVRNARFKLLYEPEGKRHDVGWLRSPYQLFDLDRDPGEERDLLHERPDDSEVRAVFATLRAELDRLRKDPPPPLRPELAPVPEATRRRLEALGYAD